MPSVNSPSERGYSYHPKSVSDLEEELRNEYKRSEQRMEKKTQELEATYKRELAEKERRLERTVSDIRQQSDDVISRVRNDSRAENERVKAETYNKHGKILEQQREQHKHEVEAINRENLAYKERSENDLGKAETNFERRLTEQHAAHNGELSRKIENSRESANELYHKAYQADRSAYQQFKADAEKEQKFLLGNLREEADFNRRFASKTIDDNKTDYERLKENFKNSLDILGRRLQEKYESRAEHDAKTTSNLRDDYTAELQRKLNDLNDAYRLFAREKANATHDAIQQYDDEWRRTLNNSVTDYEEQLQRLKDNSEISEKQIGRKNIENLAEKDRHFTEVISRNIEDNQASRRDLQDQFDQAIAMKELQLKKDREMSQKLLSEQTSKAEEEKSNALNIQNRAFREHYERTMKMNKEQAADLERKARDAAKSENSEQSRASMEHSIQKMLTSEHEKTLAAVQERDQKALDSIKQTYSERLRDTIEENKSKEAGYRRQVTSEQNLDRHKYEMSVLDLEENKAEALRNKDFENAKQSERINRNYAAVLDKQRRKYEEAIEHLKEDAAYKLITQRQESDLAIKSAHRDFIIKQNAILRENEKKLNDQKAMYESQIDDLKTQSQSAVRDAERKFKQTLEEQAKMYEHRMAQSESQHKERERTITETYQEQIERTKRLNAISNSKKG
jgi:hypothetical protein